VLAGSPVRAAVSLIVYSREVVFALMSNNAKNFKYLKSKPHLQARRHHCVQ
jgi:hypothetical protein